MTQTTAPMATVATSAHAAMATQIPPCESECEPRATCCKPVKDIKGLHEDAKKKKTKTNRNPSALKDLI